VTGLDYDRARWFDAVGGKFIGRDPIGFGGGDANEYRYVGNNALNARDQTGLYKIIFVGKNWTPEEKKRVNIMLLRARYRFQQQIHYLRMWKMKLTPCEQELIGSQLDKLSDIIRRMMRNLDSSTPLELSHSPGGWLDGDKSGTHTAPNRFFGSPPKIWLNDGYQAVDVPDILMHELSHDAGSIDPWPWTENKWDPTQASNLQDLGSFEDLSKTSIYSALKRLSKTGCPGGNAPPSSARPRSSPGPFLPWRWGPPL
jgi:hypothetical protein